MFVDLGNSIIWNMRKYKDAKWEWHLAHEIFDAYYKEKKFKDSLCEIENSTDETTESFIAVILNEMEMAQDKLKVITYKYIAYKMIYIYKNNNPLFIIYSL